MVAYRVQWTLKTSDSNPANYVTNTWCVAGVDVADCNDFITELRAFYNTMRPMYPSYIIQNGHEIKAYDMGDPEPRAPVIDTTFNFTSAPSGNPLPTEVSLCLSFQGDKLSGVPQARRRGRIYFGPINATQIATTGRPAGTLVTALSGAGAALLASSGGPVTWDWSVYSTVTASPVIISNGWVDDEFDTQRRRGRTYVSRTTF